MSDSKEGSFHSRQSHSSDAPSYNNVSRESVQALNKQIAATLTELVSKSGSHIARDILCIIRKKNFNQYSIARNVENLEDFRHITKGLFDRVRKKNSVEFRIVTKKIR